MIKFKISLVALLTLAMASVAAAKNKEPEHIEVQHILVAFQGSVPGKNITRTTKDAEKVASELLKKAKKKGSNFDELVSQNTDDAAPGRYKMCNLGVTCAGGDEYPRDRMVPAFGDVGFKLKVGEIGLAKFDPQKSPYGFHIIKRLK